MTFENMGVTAFRPHPNLGVVAPRASLSKFLDITTDHRAWWGNLPAGFVCQKGPLMSTGCSVSTDRAMQ